MLVYTIFVQIPSLVVIFTHADRQSVDISVTVCLFVFVFLSFCTVTDFSAEDKSSGVKFCMTVYRHLGQGIFHLEERCSPEAQNWTNRRLPIT